MKLKQQPDDFQVEEITAIAPTRGPFALYRLEKRGWSTPDALAALRRRWNIEPRRISYGGLKDRHAWTVQYLTIFHGPRRGLHHHDVTAQYLGQVAAPYSSRDIQANRFRLTLRDLSPDSRPAIEERLRALAHEGVPNYFDDQRFGSVAGEGGEFIARLLVQGRFEERTAPGTGGTLRIRSRRPEGGEASAGGALGRLGHAQGRIAAGPCS